MVLQAAASLWMLTWDAHSAFAAMWPPFLAIGLGVGMVMSASSDAIVGNAPRRDGGVAGGLQATSLQIGGALGTSVLVSLISGRVGSTLTGELTSAGVPANAVAALRGPRTRSPWVSPPCRRTCRPQLRAAVIEGSGNAFMNGVHSAVVVTAVLCAVGALLAGFGMRRASGPEATEA